MGTVKLVSSTDAVAMLSKFYEITNKTKASHFCSVKKEGREYFVYMKNREHNTETDDCWCSPSVKKIGNNAVIVHKYYGDDSEE